MFFYLSGKIHTCSDTDLPKLLFVAAGRKLNRHGHTKSLNLSAPGGVSFDVHTCINTSNSDATQHRKTRVSAVASLVVVDGISSIRRYHPLERPWAAAALGTAMPPNGLATPSQLSGSGLSRLLCARLSPPPDLPREVPFS
jgi:hypothetical protein